VAVVAVIPGVLAACLTIINIAVAIRNYARERQPRPHALDAAIRDIAAAVRERGPDFHLRINDKT
jgi:hypothetical protein